MYAPSPEVILTLDDEPWDIAQLMAVPVVAMNIKGISRATNFLNNNFLISVIPPNKV